MKKRTYIQLFTVRPEEHDNNLEVDGEVLAVTYGEAYVHVATKDFEHVFPWHNISMIRMWKE